MDFQFDRTKILTIGDVFVEQYLIGKADQVAEEAPVPVLSLDQQTLRPAGAAHLALQVAALGATSYLLTCFGDDAHAQSLQQALTEGGVQYKESQILPEQASSVCLRVVSQQQQLLRMDNFQRIPSLGLEKLQQQAPALLEQVDWLLLYHHRSSGSSCSEAMIKLAREMNTSVAVFAHEHRWQAYQGATVLLASDQWLKLMLPSSASQDDKLLQLQAVCEQYQIEHLIVEGEPCYHVTAMQAQRLETMPCQEVKDIIGVQEVVLASLVTALAAEQTWPQALALSAVARAQAEEKLGINTVSKATLQKLAASVQLKPLASPTDHSRNHVLKEIKQAQSFGDRVVFTNGCFDLLHAGHVAYLQEAKKLGTRLVVALNDDASVRRLKGDLRPVYSLDVRMAMVAALEEVDWVIAFEEETPCPLLELLQPDVLVKGGDYTVDTVVGAGIVHRYGGKVCIIRHDFQGCTTTTTLDKVKQTGHCIQ